MATIQQRAREREFDEIMMAGAETMRRRAIPALSKAMAQFNRLNTALAGEYSDMAQRYMESISPFADDVPGILEAAELLLSRLQAADVKGAEHDDFGAVYPLGLFGTYTPEEEE